MNTRLDVSYRLACLALILLWGVIWWTGFIDVVSAFWRWLR